MRSQKIPQVKPPRWPVFLSLAGAILFLLTIILITVLLVLITLRITETNKELATLQTTLKNMDDKFTTIEEKVNSKQITNLNHQLNQTLTEQANELGKTLRAINGKVDELDKRGKEQSENLFSALDKLDKLNTSVQQLSDSVRFVSRISAGKRKALIWFVHSKNLQESQYHPGWGELRERLNRSPFPFDFFCYVQEQGRSQRVYESGLGGQFPAYQTPATNATGRIDWQLLQNAINEVGKIDVVIIICPDNQDFNEIMQMKVPVHVVLVGGQLLVQAQNLANAQSMYLVPNSPDAVVNTLFQILQKEAAYTFATNNTHQPR